MDAATRNQFITHLILFLALAAAALLAVLAPQWVQTDAGAWVIGIVALVFVVTLLVLTSIASFGDDLEGNTFSELLRASTVSSTFYPWALAVYMGRWFHPVDDLASPLGVFGPVVLMAATWGMVVLGDVLKRGDRRIWPWLTVALGFVVGVVTWPA